MNSVRAIRLAAGLTQNELASRSAMAQPNIAAYETGQRNPSSSMLAKLRHVAPPRPSTVLAERRDEILRVARRHKANNVRVFGSVARGEDISGSDLDLLVSFEPDADIFDLADLITELEEMTELHVDIVSEGGLRPGPNRVKEEAIAL